MLAHSKHVQLLKLVLSRNSRFFLILRHIRQQRMKIEMPNVRLDAPHIWFVARVAKTKISALADELPVDKNVHGDRKLCRVANRTG